MIYRIAYAGIEGTHMLPERDFHNSPARTYATLEDAICNAEFLQSSVMGGYYKVIDENGKQVYRAAGKQVQ